MTEDTQTATKKQSALWTTPTSWNGVRGGISDTSDGILAWGRAPDSEVAASRERWARIAGLLPETCVTLDQVHGHNIICVSSEHSGSGFLDSATRIPSCDGQVTTSPEVTLVTSHADCAPVFLYCEKKRAIGLVHAGWRGTLAGIAAFAVAKMTQEYSVLPSDLDIAIGPMIVTRHYKVGDDVAELFRAKFGDGVIAQYNEKPHLDVFACLIIELLRSGVYRARFCRRPPDTFADPRWSSYRRDGSRAGGMLAYFQIK